MKADIKTKWVEALRNGNYEQAEGLLRADGKNSNYSYCCLGVLCEVLGAEWIEHTPHIGRRRLEADDEAILSAFGLELSGLDQEAQSRLAMMNDNGSTFEDIADHIERRL